MALTFAEVATPSATGWIHADVCWASGFGAAGLFVFCGDRSSGADRIETTPDGVTFTLRTGPSTTGFWRGIAYSPTLNRAVVVGQGGICGWSDDGITWANATTFPAANNWQAVCWWDAMGLFVAVSNNGTFRVATSANGKDWTNVTAAAAKSWVAVQASAGAVVALARDSGGSTQVMMRATDSAAATWALVTTAGTYLTSGDHDNPSGGSSGIGYSDDLDMLCTTVRTATDRLMLTSTDDGATWVERTIPTPTDGVQIWGVIWIGEQWFASRSGLTYLSSPDGVTWAQTTVSPVPSNSSYSAWAWSPTLRTFLSGARTAVFTALVGTAPAPPTPSLTRVIASQGRTIGGRLVRIIGTGFTGTPSVTFDGTPATDIVVISDTEISARTPAHIAGLVDVDVDGVTLVDGYRYTDSVFGVLTIRREQGILIEDTLNDAPNTCVVRCDRVGSPESPRLGEGVQIIDPASGTVLFGGTALIIRDGIDGKPSNPGYRDLDAGDLAWRLNAIRPYSYEPGKWEYAGSPAGIPADEVAQDLIDTFAPQFTLFAEAGLPPITLTCDRSQTLSEVFSTIATLIGGSWYVDDNFGVHLFLTNPDDPPDPITDASPLYDPPPTVARDLTQIRNRVYVAGAGGATSYVPPVMPLQISLTDTVTPTTGGSIPDGGYYYYISFVTESGETVPIFLTTYLFGTGFVIAGGNNAFQLTNLDLTVSLDTRVTGRRLWRSRIAAPGGTEQFFTPYLVTTLGNTIGIGENDFLDGLPDSSLTVLPPRTDTSATVFVMVEDVAAQAYLASLFADGDDGVREGYVLDDSLTTLDQATARGEAELALFAYPITTVRYACRDEKTRSGKTVSITLTNPEVSGLFKIQQVTIDQIAVDAAGLLFPRFSVVASSVRFTLDDLLRGVTRPGVGGTVGAGGGSSRAVSGVGSGSTTPSPTPLSGTKEYYVSDTSGGAVTRKITFTEGILIAET